MAEPLAPHPPLQAWLQRLRRQCAPHYDSGWSVVRVTQKSSLLLQVMPCVKHRASAISPGGRLEPWLQLPATSHNECAPKCTPHPYSVVLLRAEVHALLRQSRDRLVAHKQQQASKV